MNQNEKVVIDCKLCSLGLPWSPLGVPSDATLGMLWIYWGCLGYLSRAWAGLVVLERRSITTFEHYTESALVATLETNDFYYCIFRVYLVTGPIEGRELRHPVKKHVENCHSNA
jgi:hypothetical protein